MVPRIACETIFSTQYRTEELVLLLSSRWHDPVDEGIQNHTTGWEVVEELLWSTTTSCLLNCFAATKITKQHVGGRVNNTTILMCILGGRLELAAFT
jgi:hypothetical protein